ncbi:MAG: class I SAM-dependent methyltransferase [Gemmatimonadetes bacterium]|nr:class I SAM-dependent methyltransferase [Gemmatimonadota bacterium]
MESERPDALFRDPYARTLAGPCGAEILAAMPKGRQFAWPMIVRTAVMDELILDRVREQGVDTVLNLAAGLDARAFQLRLPSSLKWVDADLPHMLAYKEDQLRGERPVCSLEFAKLDLTVEEERRALLHRIGAAARQALVITEGLLVYLTPEQVASLAQDLHAQRCFRWWLLELGSPGLLKFIEKTWGKTLSAGGAPFRFAPAEGTAFFKQHGWNEVQYRSIFEESIRLKRTFPMARFWRWVSRFYPRKKREGMRRFSGVVLLERRA